MRKDFAEALHKEMKVNKNIFLVVADLGFGIWDEVQKDFPHRFINTGASEQSALGIAVGLAQEGKIPFVYTITSFFLRAAETINLYLHHEQCPVKLVGSGIGDDYKHDGYSHNATVIQNYLGELDIECEYVYTKNELTEDFIKRVIGNSKPTFIGIRR